MKKKSGFTLIETLAVIAIIAIIAAITFPVFGRSREASKILTCQNNLKQLYLASSLYCIDNDGAIPRFPSAMSKHLLDVGRFIPNDYTPLMIDSAKQMPAVDDYLKVYGFAKEMRRSPLDEIDWILKVEGGHKPTWFEKIGSSYDYVDVDAFNGANLSSPAEPSNAYLFITMGNFIDRGENQFKGKYNAVFFDGHVTKIGVKERYKILYPEGPPE